MKTAKKLLILIFYLGFVNSTLGQVLVDEKNQTPQELYDFHISKKKSNNTSAWITLGGGVAMIIGGIGINLSGGIIDNDTTNNNKGLWLSYLGGATTLVSIPLFVSAGKHKKKAKIQLKNGAVGFENEINYLGVAIAFSF
ncbi:hypothetical protein [Flavobacterium sp.]|jgi:hypothetical protein|uniref:hypothetical protein n=1 Tax=Flavobacterium sp. TaxID=239 RepID=UPI002A83A0E8|nr:hypothetical protein [Flavobacterium sp.]